MAKDTNNRDIPLHLDIGLNAGKQPLTRWPRYSRTMAQMAEALVGEA